MWYELLWVSLWGGIVALDTTAALQIMISRPLVACTIAGLLLGNAPVAFVIGVLMELVYICELPVGGAWFSEGNVGAVAATALAVFVLDATHRISPVLAIALILAIGLSLLGGFLVKKMRMLNVKIYHHLMNTKRITAKHVAAAQYSGLFLAFLIGFGLTLSAVLLFYFPLVALIQNIPVRYDIIFRPVGGALLGAGCGFLINMVLKQNKYKWLLAVGLLAGVLFFYL